MSPAYTVATYAGLLTAELALAYWPVLAPRLPRVRRIDDPFPCMVLVLPTGTDVFLWKVRSK